MILEESEIFSFSLHRSIPKMARTKHTAGKSTDRKKKKKLKDSIQNLKSSLIYCHVGVWMIKKRK